MKRTENQKLLMFINISALHQPNYFYLEGATEDGVETQIAALAYVDQQLGALFEAFENRGKTFCLICSDHGTCYGEDGYTGHRIAHEKVFQVPYQHFYL